MKQTANLTRDACADLNPSYASQMEFISSDLSSPCFKY